MPDPYTKSYILHEDKLNIHEALKGCSDYKVLVGVVFVLSGQVWWFGIVFCPCKKKSFFPLCHPSGSGIELPAMLLWTHVCWRTDEFVIAAVSRTG